MVQGSFQDFLRIIWIFFLLFWAIFGDSWRILGFCFYYFQDSLEFWGFLWGSELLQGSFRDSLRIPWFCFDYFKTFVGFFQDSLEFEGFLWASEMLQGFFQDFFLRILWIILLFYEVFKDSCEFQGFSRSLKDSWRFSGILVGFFHYFTTETFLGDSFRIFLGFLKILAILTGFYEEFRGFFQDSFTILWSLWIFGYWIRILRGNFGGDPCQDRLKDSS